MTIKLERAAKEGFNAVLASSRGEFLAIAKYLLRCWRTGPDIDAEDVLQELMLAAWQTSKRFDPKRSSDMTAFALFQARTVAKRAIHKARGAKRKRSEASLDNAKSKLPDRLDWEQVERRWFFAWDHRGTTLGELLSDIPVADATVLALVCLEPSTRKAATRIIKDRKLSKLLRVNSRVQAEARIKKTFKLLREAA